MALIQQDNTGLIAGVNSYATVAEFIAYWADRGEDYSTTPTTAEIEAYLVKGWQYTDTRFKYKGSKLNGRTQPTEFPRINLYDCEGFAIDDVPYEIKNAQIEYAKRELDGVTLQDDSSVEGNIKRIKSKVDVIEEEIEYSPALSGGEIKNYPTADSKIPSYFICEIEAVTHA